MTKLIVETYGSYQLTGSTFDRSDAVPFDRPAVVVQNLFIQIRLDAHRDFGGALKNYGEVADIATDADWERHLTELGWEAGVEDFDFQAAFDAYEPTEPVALTEEEVAAQDVIDKANRPNDTGNVAPTKDNAGARAAKKTHQAPAEG